MIIILTLLFIKATRSQSRRQVAVQKGTLCRSMHLRRGSRFKRHEVQFKAAELRSKQYKKPCGRKCAETWFKYAFSLHSIFLPQEGCNLLRAWELKLIFTDEQLLIKTSRGIFCSFCSHLCTQKNTYRRIIVRLHLVLAVIIEVHVQLGNIGIIQLMGFQFHQTMSLDDTIIED